MRKKGILWTSELFLASGLLFVNSVCSTELKDGAIVNVVSGTTTAIAVGPGSHAVSGGISVDGQNLTNTGNAIQDSGVNKTERRALSPYHSVEIDNFPGEVTLHSGTENSAIITADQAIIPAIKTKVVNNILYIAITESINTQTPLQLTINTEEISSLRLNGSGDTILENIFTDHLYLEINGSGSITARGKTRELEVILSGSGDIKADRLVTEQCIAKIEGAGDITVHTTGVLTAEINGAGDIIYSGNPSKTIKNINGAGSIEAAAY